MPLFTQHIEMVGASQAGLHTRTSYLHTIHFLGESDEGTLRHRNRDRSCATFVVHGYVPDCGSGLRVGHCTTVAEWLFGSGFDCHCP